MAKKGITVAFLSESARIVRSPSSGFHIWVTRCRLAENSHHLKGPALSRSFGVTDRTGNDKDVTREARGIPATSVTSYRLNSQISRSDLTDDGTNNKLIVAKDLLSTTTSAYIKSSQDLTNTPEEKLAEMSELLLEFRDNATRIHELLKEFNKTDAEKVQEIWKIVMQDATTDINQLLTDLSARVRILEEGAERYHKILLEIKDLLIKGKSNAVEEGDATTENLDAAKEILQEVKKYKDIKNLDDRNEGLQAVSQLLLDFLKGNATKVQLKEAMRIFWKKTCVAAFKGGRSLL